VLAALRAKVGEGHDFLSELGGFLCVLDGKRLLPRQQSGPTSKKLILF
jgi:hypothetical protein